MSHINRKKGGCPCTLEEANAAIEYIQALESKNKELVDWKKMAMTDLIDAGVTVANQHSKIESLEAELNKHKWISVSDRLPEDNAVVLVFSESGLDSDYYYADRWQRNEITHWKPITPPKGE